MEKLASQIQHKNSLLAKSAEVIRALEQERDEALSKVAEMETVLEAAQDKITVLSDKISYINKKAGAEKLASELIDKGLLSRGEYSKTVDEFIASGDSLEKMANIIEKIHGHRYTPIERIIENVGDSYGSK
jgi:septal ring factor EnvC (AmiA/AmiB activator)